MSKSHSRGWRVLASLVAVCLTLLGLELGYRVLSSLGWLPQAWIQSGEKRERFREHVASGVRGMFDPKAFVGYSLRGETVNAEGFADREWPLKRTPDALRIACLGGSTTQDGMRENRSNTYPHYLSRILGRRLKKEVEVLNFGVNGWTSAESLVNYALVVSHYQPDVVVVHHAANDVWPRLYPDYRLDYTHYRVPWIEANLSCLDRTLVRHSWLWTAWRMQDEDLMGIRERVIRRVDGEPIPILTTLAPDTTTGYRANLGRLCRLIRADGAVPLLMTMPFHAGGGGLDRVWIGLLEQGTEEHNEVMRSVASEEGVLLADVDRTFTSQPEEHAKLFTDYLHVNSDGNRVKALSIIDVLEEAKIFK